MNSRGCLCVYGEGPLQSCKMSELNTDTRYRLVERVGVLQEKSPLPSSATRNDLSMCFSMLFKNYQFHTDDLELFGRKEKTKVGFYMYKQQTKIPRYKYLKYHTWSEKLFLFCKELFLIKTKISVKFREVTFTVAAISTKNLYDNSLNICFVIKQNPLIQHVIFIARLQQ